MHNHINLLNPFDPCSDKKFAHLHIGIFAHQNNLHSKKCISYILLFYLHYYPLPFR